MKKATGMTRNLDSLGRIVIPKELRMNMDLDLHDPLEIFVNGDEIILRKYTPGCSLCGQVDSPITSVYPGKKICTTCIKIIAEKAAKLNRTAT
ncbi:AbrB family transcriptional regulator [Paenibacillus mucilaginosus 3016]|uniref:AbrB family transcriptional regulator n=1 Tax=Paenibacillus mucilaginosus 3016 TaxID=1116391 RepID=H6NER1_9BACL|nr:AbrB/MazE/SpoVT family DNA-binding domain-containing protein [Paenibacillus mucilaginosus]AFC28365.1 AbrB family transcriptional regulator [Paenibacillus mucilaginosus 3016]WFA17166.1 AbrB/MazE/SpoVT family DNA-binding domain-containing protein [Paenibacillus mucilaginosus]